MIEEGFTLTISKQKAKTDNFNPCIENQISPQIKLTTLSLHSPGRTHFFIDKKKYNKFLKESFSDSSRYISTNFN